MIPDEQIEQIKQQLISQIDSTFPEDKKENAKQQILSMNKEEFLEFLDKNNLIKQSNSAEQPKQIQCIACSIVSGEVPSYKINENKCGVAVLEINPISKGHVLVLPKKHISNSTDIPQSCFSLAKKISKKIKSKLKVKDILISTRNLFGHYVIDVIPIYETENANSPHYKASEQELKEMQSILKIESKPKQLNQKIKKISNKEIIRFPRRIP